MARVLCHSVKIREKNGMVTLPLCQDEKEIKGRGFLAIQSRPESWESEVTSPSNQDQKVRLPLHPVKTRSRRMARLFCQSVKTRKWKTGKLGKGVCLTIQLRAESCQESYLFWSCLIKIMSK